MKNSLYIKQLMLSSGITRLCRCAFQKTHLAILRYHSTAYPGQNFYIGPSISLDPEIFEKQVAHITRRYSVVSLDAVYNHLKGLQKIPKNAVVFTFDDGYADNYQAYQILRKYHATGTFYISAGCVDGEPLWLFEVLYLINNSGSSRIDIILNDQHISYPIASPEDKTLAIRGLNELIKSNDLQTRQSIRAQLKAQTRDVTDLEQRGKEIMLTWDQIREMSANGMTIASHTLSHLNLPNAQPEDAQQEIVQSKELLENQIQAEVAHFSYPNGGNYDYYNDSVKEMVKQAGYKTATTSNNGVVRPEDDVLELSRIRTTPHLAEIVYQIDCEPLFR